MKATLSGCMGTSENRIDTDCIIHKRFFGGVILIAIDTQNKIEPQIAEQVAGSILTTWETNPDISKKRMVQCIKVGQEIENQASILMVVIGKDRIGIAQTGTNKLFILHDSNIKEVYSIKRSIAKRNVLEVSIKEYKSADGDAFLIATDGFWKMIHTEEILIDWIKSKTAAEWMSYMATRIGLRLEDATDCYSAMAFTTEE